ncbi:hypothetical protein PR048_017264 [Dryococelus australis]|uniref:Uncharacterized protein n=1 Tax=Dryococelus australis TaxID=614101 RepID=A0ABQ9H9N1_9NEOP|nr:hypothetical protein PR048_017264 [Dryococelus australis]
MERRWNAGRGKREYPEKTRRQASSSSTIPTSGSESAGDRARIVLVGGERPSHCATSAHIIARVTASTLEDNVSVVTNAVSEPHDDQTSLPLKFSGCGGTKTGCSSFVSKKRSLNIEVWHDKKQNKLRNPGTE